MMDERPTDFEMFVKSLLSELATNLGFPFEQLDEPDDLASLTVTIDNPPPLKALPEPGWRDGFFELRQWSVDLLPRATVFDIEVRRLDPFMSIGCSWEKS